MAFPVICPVFRGLRASWVDWRRNVFQKGLKDVLRLDAVIAVLGGDHGRGWANHVLVDLLLWPVLVRSGPGKIAKYKYSFLRFLRNSYLNNIEVSMYPTTYDHGPLV